MDRNMILLIAAAVLLVIAVIVLVVVLVRSGRAPSHHVVMSDGIDIDTQRKGTDAGSIFQGTYDQDGTIVLEGESRRTCRITLVNLVTGEQHPLQFRQSAGIGRSEDLKELETFLTIRNDARVSRFHCRLFSVNGEICIEDAGSSNHTMVNDRQITHPCVLHTGDIIRVGNTWLRVML